MGLSIIEDSYEINFPHDGEIKETYLLAYSPINNSEFVPNTDFIVNGNILSLQKKDEISFIKRENNLPTTDGSIGYKIYAKNLNQFIMSNSQSLFIKQQVPSFIPSECPACFLSGFVVVVIYEDATLPPICFQQIINQFPEVDSKTLNLKINNFSNSQNDIALAIMSDRLGDGLNDAYFFQINSNNIGVLNLKDEPFNSAGVMGCFKYQNGFLTGFYDDDENQVINGSNGIMKINGITSYNEMEIKIENIPPEPTYANNFLLGYNLVYSTPCEPFEVVVPRDTTFCQGASFSLQASGGQRYKWLPETSLSCYDCANPTFTADTTTFYSLQIFSSDSCSVIRTVRLFVEEPKTVSAQSTNASFCGGATGSVIMQSNAFYNRYSVDGVLFPVGTTLSNLSSGLHEIVGVSETGCSSVPITVAIDSINTTVADFWRTPLEGTAPLNVNFENKSEQATNFLWQVDTLFYQNIPNPYTFTEPGWHTITLYAWKYDTLCADTVSKTVFVRIPQIIPTAFTPNNDGDNDVWELPYIDILFPENQVFVYNRWGNLLYASKKGAYATQAWDGNFEGKPLPVGSYFYVIEFNNEDYPKATGQVSVIRK